MRGLFSISVKRRVILVCCALGAVLSGLISGCIHSNTSPVIVTMDAAQAVLRPGESSAVSVVAYDPDSDEITYQWTADGGKIAGQGPEVTWTAPVVEGDYSITAVVSDGQGGEMEMHKSFQVVPNNLPVISSLDAERSIASLDNYVVFECLASDADDDELTYNWSADGGEFYGSGPVITWKAPLQVGSYRINVTVDDGQGGEVSYHRDMLVEVNHAPVISHMSATITVVTYGDSTDVTCSVTDLDDDELTYIWSAPEGEITGEGNVITWTAPDMCGEYVIVSVLVLDNRGGTADAEISLRVKKPG